MVNQSRWVRLIPVAVLHLLLSGCQSEEVGPPLIPVRGIVKLDDKPLDSGGISFRDETNLIQPTGVIQPDGTYELFDGKRAGAPAGRYRVIVFVTEPTSGPQTGHGGLPKLIIDRKYTDPRTTPLTVEVKPDAAAGAYDFTVTK
jgi:hypothetical protein